MNIEDEIAKSMAEELTKEIDREIYSSFDVDMYQNTVEQYLNLNENACNVNGDIVYINGEETDLTYEYPRNHEKTLNDLQRYKRKLKIKKYKENNERNFIV
jgi:hypothetical protein